MATQQCAQERASIGKKAFRKRYGKRSMRACAKRNRGQVAAAVRTISQDCQDELNEFGEATFIELYSEVPTAPLELAMDECIAEGIDQILNPEDWSDDSDDDE